MVSTHTEPLSVREGGRGGGFIWGCRKAITNSLSHPNHVHGGFPWHTNSYSLILCVSLRVCVLSIWWIFILNITRKLQNTLNTQRHSFSLSWSICWEKERRIMVYGLYEKKKWIAISNLVMLQNSYKINWDLKASPKSSLFKQVSSVSSVLVTWPSRPLWSIIVSHTDERHPGNHELGKSLQPVGEQLLEIPDSMNLGPKRGFTKNLFAIALVASRLLLLPIVCMAGANLSANSWRPLSK